MGYYPYLKLRTIILIVYLHTEERDACQQVNSRLKILQLLRLSGGKVVSIHGQVNPERVVQRV